MDVYLSGDPVSSVFPTQNSLQAHEKQISMNFSSTQPSETHMGMQFPPIPSLTPRLVFVVRSHNGTRSTVSSPTGLPVSILSKHLSKVMKPNS